MKNLKKITAITAIIAMLLTNSISFAENAAINDATASLVTGFANSNKIQITSGNNFPVDEEISSATITNLNGTAVGTTELVVDGNDADPTSSTVTISGSDLVDNTSYIISFVTEDGDFGQTTLRIGEPTEDAIVVTATVQPILKFELEENSANLGTLTDAFGLGVNKGVEVGTNAVGGLNVTAISSNGGLKSATATHTIQSGKVGSIYENEGYQFTSTALDETANNDSEGSTTMDGLVPTLITNSDSVTIYTTDKPQNFDTGVWDTTFNVAAKIAESTPAASDYTDVIIFTATANF